MFREQTEAIFLSGPRQVGKIWLARTLMEGFERPRYLNWDNIQDREIILGQGWSAAADLVVLDEIHKMDGWKNHLKGIWDVRPSGLSILLKAMNLLVELLRERTASPLSCQGLSEDLGVSPNTVKRYLEVLEALYIIFRVYPHHRSIARSLVQQPKVYFFDTALVRGDRGKRLENAAALSLLRELCLQEDRDGKARALRYLRTKEGKEVDFVLTEEGEPLLMVEVKAADRNLSSGLRYFHERYGIPGIQLVEDIRAEYASGPLRILRAQDWLEQPDIRPTRF